MDIIIENKGITLIAVAGGIGSGKSVISRILTVLGYSVYDCDSRAKRLMDCSAEIKRRISEEIDREAVTLLSPTEWGEAAINRGRLAQVVFADVRKLRMLNSIVHANVIDDIIRWRRMNAECGSKVVFVESAVLFASGLYRHVDAIWHVTASDTTRLQRAMSRDNATEQEIAARMESQSHEQRMLDETSIPVYTIDNNGTVPVLPRILQLLSADM